MKSHLAPELEFVPLDKKYATVVLIRWVPAALLILVALYFLTFELLGSDNVVVAAFIFVPLAAFTIWQVYLAVRRAKVFGYVEQENELLVRKGVMFQRLTVVPYGRMQQVKISSGPVLKHFGLASIDLVTASAATDASIPGLRREEAERLRHKLTELGEARMEGL